MPISGSESRATLNPIAVSVRLSDVDIADLRSWPSSLRYFVSRNMFEDTHCAFAGNSAMSMAVGRISALENLLVI